MGHGTSVLRIFHCIMIFNFPMDELVSAWFIGIWEKPLAVPYIYCFLQYVYMSFFSLTDVEKSLVSSSDAHWYSSLMEPWQILEADASTPCYLGRSLKFVFGSFAWSVLFPSRICVNADGFESWSSENWWLWLFQLHLCVTSHSGGPVGPRAASGFWHSALAGFVWGKACLSVW